MVYKHAVFVHTFAICTHTIHTLLTTTVVAADLRKHRMIKVQSRGTAFNFNRHSGVSQ